MELRAQGLDVGGGVGSFFVELEAADVDALQVSAHLGALRFLGIFRG
jgi:hypothetical protein